MQTQTIFKLSWVLFLLLMTLMVIAIGDARGQTVFDVGETELNAETKLYLDNFQNRDVIYVCYGTADDKNGSGRRNTELAPLRAIAAAAYLRSSGIIAVASSIPLTRQTYRTVYIDAIPISAPYDDSETNRRLAILESENKTLKSEFGELRRTLGILGDALDDKFMAVENEITEAGSHKFGFVVGISRLISLHATRQNYSAGLSYALSPALRMEGSVLLGGSYENQGSDLGGKLFARYRIEGWEIGAGWIYRAVGRRDDPGGEDDKYLAISPAIRYYFGVPFVEIGYAYEWLMNWHKEPALFTQRWNEHRFSIGFGVAFE